MRVAVTAERGGGTKRKGVCNFYARTKSCRFGDKCKFEHEGNGGGAAMMSKKAKKKAKKEIIESAMQAVKAKVAAASNGEVKLKDGKDDEIYAMIASSAEAHGWASMMLTDEPSETEAATMAAKSTAGKELLEDLSKC